MHLKFKIFSLLSVILFFSLIFSKSAFADTTTLTGHVQDSTGTSIGGATVTVNDTNNDSTTTDPSTGNYSISVPAGTYNIQVTPSSGSSYSSAIAYNQNISTATILNFTLTATGTITLSGHVYDSQGIPVKNQQVIWGTASSITDASGSYSLQASSGTNQFTVTDNSNRNNDFSLKVPEDYNLYKENYNITQDTILDVHIPLKQVTVHIQDPSGTAIVGATVRETVSPDSNYVNNGGLSMGGGITTASSDYSNYDPGPQTDSSGNVILWLLPNNSNFTYDFTAIPQTGSIYAIGTLSNVHITSDTTKTIMLQHLITISGHVYDSQGTPVQNQQVIWGNNAAFTDASGSYTIQAGPGTNQLTVTDNSSRNNDFSRNVPEDYNLYQTNYTITQDKTIDITIPVKQVTIHVQNTSGTALSGIVVRVTTSPDSNFVNNGGLSMGSGITTASADYSNYDPGPQTDSSGNVILWLLPNNSNYTYDFTTLPPNGGIYSVYTLNNTQITSSQTKVFLLQYNHSTPVTTANLATQNSNGTYSNPTTVTLAVTAAASYNVVNTYYTVDGGSQQTYASPFTVTGNGSHTITYWSVDNSGVIESTNTKTFSISAQYNLTGTVYVDANQNGVQGMGESGYPGATVTLNTGQTTTTDSNGYYTFSNLESGTYIDTLTVPSGYSATTTNPAEVALSANTTQNFGIAQASSLVTAINAGGGTAGSFAADTGFSGGSSFSSSSPVDTTGVQSPAPQAVYQTVRYGNFNYTVPNLTPNTAYTLRLHFNEVYFGANGNSGGVGSRVFNVSVNGTTALNNFDIYQAAGGANKAVVEELPATSDSNGNITVQFTSVVDNAMVNGIEVDSGSPATTPTPTPTPITSEAINAGGTTSGSFLSDIDSTGGNTFSTTASIDRTRVTSPAPESVYQSVRYGNFTYDLTNFAPNSNHTVRLHFSEPYWGTALASGTGGDGSRVFNVSVNGTQVLTNFDVYQTAGGADKAVIEEFPVTADSNGKISIQFSTVVDNAIVSGIEVN